MKTNAEKRLGSKKPVEPGSQVTMESQLQPPAGSRTSPKLVLELLFSFLCFYLFSYWEGLILGFLQLVDPFILYGHFDTIYTAFKCARHIIHMYKRHKVYNSGGEAV